MNSRFLKISSAITLVITLLVGCGEKNASIPNNDTMHYFSDMEQYTGFVEGAPVMLYPNAHSGKYLVRIDNSNPYGIGFKRKLNEISANKIMKVDVAAFIYADTIPVNASLVCVVDNNDNVPVYYETVDLNKQVSKAKEWTKVSATFYFPDTLKPEQRIVVYCFNPNNTSIYLDDFELNFAAK